MLAETVVHHPCAQTRWTSQRSKPLLFRGQCVHREVRVEASFILQVRPIQSSPAPHRLCRNAFCPGASIWINSTGSLRFICQFLLCSPRDRHLQGWQEYNSGCQEKTLWGRLAHSISPTQVDMEMEQGVHRQNRVGAPSPNPSIPGCTLAFSCSRKFKTEEQKSWRNLSLLPC